MSAFQILKFASEQALDTAANVLAGATLSFSLTGTSTATNAYADKNLTIPLANPLSADAAGNFVSIFLDPTITYRVVLKSSAGVTLKTWDPANEQLLTQALIGFYLYPRTSAEISAGVTPVNYAWPPYDLRRYMVAGTYATQDQSAAIQAATDAAYAAGAAEVYFPEATIRFDSQIVPRNGVRWIGAGKNATTLKYYGSGVAINATGTSGSRIITTIQDVTIDGSNYSNVNAQCITLGWNMRSATILARVRIYNFPHYAIHFTDQNWNVDFVDVEVDTCGYGTSNSAGIYKDPGVDTGTWNAITFDRCIVEGCGRSDSTAGGINIQTTTANRGLYFTNCIVEGNFGADEIYITNMADCHLQIYNERINGTNHNIFCELSGCTGTIVGRYCTGELATYSAATTNGSAVVTFNNPPASGMTVLQATDSLRTGMQVVGTGIPVGATILSIQSGTGVTLDVNATATTNPVSLSFTNTRIGYQFKADCQFSIDGVHFNNWYTACVDVQGSKLRVGHCPNITIKLDSTAQIFGEICPTFEAQKSGNQTGIVTNTFTKVSFQTENYDATGTYDNATNYRFTPQTIGRYFISASVAWDDVETAGDQFIIAIYRNGTLYRLETYRAYATEPFNQTISAQVRTTATTDYFEVYVRHLGTNNRTVNADATATWFAGHLLEVT